MPSYGNTAFQAAAPGLGKIAAALGGGGGAFQQGRQDGAMYQSRIAQALAQQRAHESTADFNEARAASERAGLEAQSPGALRNNAMLSAGVPLGEAPTVDAYLQTGKLGSRYDTPAVDGVGPVMPAPDWTSKLGTVAASIGSNQNAMALGDKNSENVAKAREIDRVAQHRDDSMTGKLDPMLFAKAQYAAKGSAPYAFHEFGVGNNLTGKIDDSGGVATGFAKKRQSEIDENNAQAGSARASANSSSASAAKTRSEMERGIKSGDIVVQQAADGTIMLVNKMNGLSRPATSADGVPIQGKGPAGGGGKPLPAAALKMQQEALDAIGTSGSINADLTAITQQIEDGKLQLGPMDNLIGQGRNLVGLSNENSRNLASLKANLEKLRNDSLRLNKGVQTDGDAQRAWNELLANINDPGVVTQRLGEIQKINERGAALRQMDLDGIRQNYGLPPLDGMQQRFGQPAAVGGSGQGAATVQTGGKSAAPAVGAIIDGFRFKGGKAADKANWEKVQ